MNIRDCFFRLFLFITFVSVIPQGHCFVPEAGYYSGGTEIIALRDAFSRHLSNGDGTVTAEISVYPIHGKTRQGEWVPIEDLDVEVVIETFEYTYATGHCAYDGTNYGKTDMGLIKVEREIVIYPASFVDRVGWMRFNLESLPEDVTVTGVQCQYIVTYFELSMGLAFGCLLEDPVPTGAETLYNALWNSEICAMGDRQAGVVLWNLGPIAADHIQQALPQDWVAFGITGYNYSSIITKRTWIIGWNVEPRENAPRLFVTYIPPGTTPTPTETPVAVTVTPTPNPTNTPIPTWTPAATSTAGSPTITPTHTPSDIPPVPTTGGSGILLILIGLTAFIVWPSGRNKNR